MAAVSAGESPSGQVIRETARARKVWLKCTSKPNEETGGNGLP
jgi:hypothetical protein